MRNSRRPPLANLPLPRYNYPMLTHLYDLTHAQLVDLLAEWGYSAYHADKIWAALYQQRAPSIKEMAGLRPELHARLQRETAVYQPVSQLDTSSSDGLTRKFLLQLADGHTIETVLMRFAGSSGVSRATACISAQVGCALGCVFCATGQMGFTRHLSPGEIVSQVLHVADILQINGEKLRNIVFMGMGEPLHNYENVMTAVAILTDHKGLAIAPRHITLSTVGIVPGILRLASEGPPIRLAVSLHAASDTARQALLPVAHRWPLAELIAACRTYSAQRKRRIFFEWTLIENENDTPEQAHALGQLLNGMNAHVNLIPLNPTVGYAGEPTHNATAQQFQSILSQYDLPSTIRQRRGIDIVAGCGQLKAREIKV